MKLCMEVLVQSITICRLLRVSPRIPGNTGNVAAKSLGITAQWGMECCGGFNDPPGPLTWIQETIPETSTVQQPRSLLVSACTLTAFAEAAQRLAAASPCVRLCPLQASSKPCRLFTVSIALVEVLYLTAIIYKYCCGIAGVGFSKILSPNLIISWCQKPSPWSQGRKTSSGRKTHTRLLLFSSHSFWTSSSLNVPAGVTQEEGHTGFLIHLLSAVRALIYLARRIQPFLSLVDREVEFCVRTNDLIVLHPLGIFFFFFFFFS